MNKITGHGATTPPIPSDQDASGRLLGDEEIALVTEAVDYAPSNYPGVYAFLRQVLVLPWNERLRAVHIDHIARQIAEFSDSAMTELSL